MSAKVSVIGPKKLDGSATRRTTRHVSKCVKTGGEKDWKTIERQYNSVEDTITSITVERTISELRRPVSSIPLWCSWWDGVELW